MALIAVLWLVLLLTVMALTASHASIRGRNAQSESLKRRQAELSADAAIRYALLELRRRPAGSALTQNQAVEWNQVAHPVRVSREGERLDLNAAEPTSLYQYFVEKGVSDTAAAALVANLIAWRRGGSGSSDDGAYGENEAHLARPVGFRGGPLEAVEELRQVPGGESLTDKQLSGLTVYTHVADPGVQPTVALDSNVFGELLRLEACVPIDTGSAMCRRAVVRLVSKAEQPWQVFQWQSTPMASESSP